MSADLKLHALGIGWTFTALNVTTKPPTTMPCAVAFILQVPWDETNRKVKWLLDLHDSDGRPVEVSQNPGDVPQPVHAENEFIVGRPPHIKPGSPISVPFALNIGPMPLAPDRAYEWVLRVGEQSWRAAFATAP